MRRRSIRSASFRRPRLLAGSWLALLTLVLPLSAAEGPPGPVPGSDHAGTLYLAFDNDVIVGSDDDYTNGGLLGWVSVATPSWRTVPGFSWLAPVTERVPGMQRGDRWKALSIEFAHLMFTPESIERTVSRPGDRPFAGVTYTSLALHQYNRNHLDSVDLLVGLVGPSTGAGDAQEWVHQLIGADQPRGWDQQVGDQVLVNIGYEHRWRALELGDIHHGPGSDIILGGSALLGTYRTSAQLDLSWRLGYRVHSGFGTTSVNPISSGRLTPGLNGDPWGCFLSAGVTAEAVAHDVTLDGRLWADDPVTVESQPLVGRAFVALGGHFRDLQLAVQMIGSTTTFEDERDPPLYGRAMLGWSF